MEINEQQLAEIIKRHATDPRIVGAVIQRPVIVCLVVDRSDDASRKAAFDAEQKIASDLSTGMVGFELMGIEDFCEGYIGEEVFDRMNVDANDGVEREHTDANR